MRVRKVERAADDGYAFGLVMGLHASADAELLALELACASERLAALERQPPGSLAEVRRLADAGELEEALWLTFLIAAIGPLEEGDAFAEIERVRVPWATGAALDLTDVRVGPRGVADAQQLPATIDAYRAWAHRGSGQETALGGEPSWTAERRFERAFERLALPGLRRAARFELLVLVGTLGLVDLAPWSLHVASDPRDGAVLAAKRVFGIGDPLLLEKRAGELARACGLPTAPLDLALANWARRTDDPAAERWHGGVPCTPDADLVALIRAELGLHEAGEQDEPAADEPA